MTSTAPSNGSRAGSSIKSERPSGPDASRPNRLALREVRREPANIAGGSAMRDCFRRRGRYQQGMTIQWRRAAGVGLVAALTLAACQPATSPGPSPTTGASATTAASTRGKGDDLKILSWQAPTILNPHLATGTKDFDAARLVLEPLAAWGPDGKAIPALASEIPTIANGGISADLKTVTWEL